MGRVRIPLTFAAFAALTIAAAAPRSAWSPIGAAAAYAQPTATEVPLSVAGGWLIVPVQTADGRSLRFALHTAIATSLIKASVAGDDPAALGLTLAGSSDPFVDMAVYDDDAFERDGTRIDGFLGLQLLGDVDVLIDAPNDRMLLKPIGRRVEWPGVDLAEPSRMRIYHGVALRTEIEVEGQPFSATINLAAAVNTATDGVAHKTGVAVGSPATVRIGSANHTMALEFGSTPILDRWDPDGAGFVAFGAALAVECAVSISYVHQELRTCVR